MLEVSAAWHYRYTTVKEFLTLIVNNVIQEICDYLFSFSVNHNMLSIN